MTTTDDREYTSINLQNSTGRTLACRPVTSPVTVSVDHQMSYPLTIASRIERDQIFRVAQRTHQSCQATNTVFISITQVTSQKTNCVDCIISIISYAEWRLHSAAIESWSLSVQFGRITFSIVSVVVRKGSCDRFTVFQRTCCWLSHNILQLKNRFRFRISKVTFYFARITVS